MTKPVLGYWAIRGYAEQTRLLLRYLGVDFEDKQYRYGPGPDFSQDEWLSEKFNLGLDFPNLPYWIDENVKLTESKAILKYVASVYGKNMVPENIKDTAVADMVVGMLSDLQRDLVRLAYGRTTPTDDPIEVSAAKPLENLSKYLGDNTWVLSNSISYVDFVMYEVLKQYTKFRPEFLKNEPKLEAYLKRFEELPQLKDYIVSIEGLVSFSPLALQF